MERIGPEAGSLVAGGRREVGLGWRSRDAGSTAPAGEAAAEGRPAGSRRGETARADWTGAPSGRGPDGEAGFGGWLSEGPGADVVMLAGRYAQCQRWRE